MTRWSQLVSIFTLTLAFTLDHTKFVTAQNAAGPGDLATGKTQQTGQPSVSDMVAILKAVDPYLPPKDPNAVTGSVKVHGSTSMDALAHVWASGFSEFHKAVKVEIAASGSFEAFEHLVANPSCVAMLSHPVRDAELAALKEKGLKQPVAFVVAREALGIFVHKTNPVQAITGEQMRAVFTTDAKGVVPTWGQLGATGDWANKPIHVIARSETSGTQVYLRDFVFGGSTMREGVSKHVSNAETLAAVTADPLGIAICGLKSTGASVRPLSLKAANNLIPSDEHAVLSGQYPLTRALTLVIDMGQSDANAKAAQEYVHFALCQSGQASAIGASFFPVDLPLLRASLHKLQGEQMR
jgi:phosphate transport system substrate-binding protein